MSQTFGGLLRYLRRRNGMTQSDLAERLGYSRSLIAALETGRRRPNIGEVISHYLPALDLRDMQDLAQQLVDLATRAHGTTLLAAGPLVTAHRLSLHPSDERHARRVPTPPIHPVGREREVQTLCDRFLHKDVRLLTLAGPPGVGKTTLALAMAARLQYLLPDGACFVPLTGITNPDHLATTLLDALGVAKWSGTALNALVACLRHKEMLLVLDNFEQILAAAPQVAHLLEECGGIQALVTSRERLHLRAEHVVQVKPLSIDAAVDLFLARAGAVNASLLASEVDRLLTESICRRLDCLPLSLELCAAQADFFSLEQILARMDAGTLSTLVDGAADLPPRHRTLRATIQASYALLNAHERALLHMLSVFIGGCSLPALEEMWSPVGVNPTMSEVLRSLAAKSLVNIATTSTGDKRVHLLEAVREFARERLDAEGEPAAVRARHFDVTLRLGRLVNQHYWTVNGLRRMNLELDNVQAALQWAFEEQRWTDLVLLLHLYSQVFRSGGKHFKLYEWHTKLLPVAHGLGPDVEMIVKMNYCYYAEGDRVLQRQFVQEYLGLANACKDPLIKALAIINGFDLGVHYPDEQEALRHAVALARAERDAQGTESRTYFEAGRELILPYAIFMQGCHLVNHGWAHQAPALLQESLARFHEINGIGDPSSQGFLGRAALILGDELGAIHWYQKAIASATTFGDERSVAVYHAFLGQAMLYSGDVDGARQMLVQAWDESEAFGDPFVMQIGALFLADLAFFDGDTEQVCRWIAESASLSARSSRELDWRHIHRAMLAAQLAASDGDDQRAALLYGFMRAYLDRITLGPYPAVRDTAAPIMAEVRLRMGDDAYLRAYAAGRDTAPETALTSLLLPRPQGNILNLPARTE